MYKNDQKQKQAETSKKHQTEKQQTTKQHNTKANQHIKPKTPKQ